MIDEALHERRRGAATEPSEFRRPLPALGNAGDEPPKRGNLRQLRRAAESSLRKGVARKRRSERRARRALEAARRIRTVAEADSRRRNRGNPACGNDARKRSKRRGKVVARRR